MTDEAKVNGTTAWVRGVDVDENKIKLERTSDNSTLILPRIRKNLELEGGEAVVEQYPIRLAWAITIHKSQGATLDAVAVDVGKGTFSAGQAYVAISRSRSLSTLYILAFEQNSFRCDPSVVQFYKRLAGEEVDVPKKEVLDMESRALTRSGGDKDCPSRKDCQLFRIAECVLRQFMSDTAEWIQDDLQELEQDLDNPERHDVAPTDLVRWGACTLRQHMDLLHLIRTTWTALPERFCESYNSGTVRSSVMGDEPEPVEKEKVVPQGVKKCLTYRGSKAK